MALAPLIATYTVGSLLAWRRAFIALALSVLVWVSWAFLDPMNAGPADFFGALVWLAPGIIAWLIGSLVRATRLNAEQRRLNREQRAAQAVAEERNRIARELHDVIGHSVSVMTVQASAVRRRLAAEQVVERRALETVEATGREALAEMRRMVGVLRRRVLILSSCPRSGSTRSAAWPRTSVRPACPSRCRCRGQCVSWHPGWT